jgi:hypothetical protein
MLELELDRLQVIHSEFMDIYLDQHNLADSLESLLDKLDISKVQNIIE